MMRSLLFITLTREAFSAFLSPASRAGGPKTQVARSPLLQGVKLDGRLRELSFN